MKSLMDVIKTLIKINGALALLTFIVVMAVREKEPKMMSEASQFRRDIQAIPSEDQQKIANIEAKLQENALSSPEKQKIAENSQKIAQIQEKLQQKALSSEDQQKIAEYEKKIADLQAKSQQKALSSEDQQKIAENSQKIANLQAKSQEKDQQLQQIQRQLTAYQNSQTAQRKIPTTEIASNLDKNPIKNSSSVAQAQLTPQPRPISPVAQIPSPAELSRSQSEYGLSRNRFPQNLALVTPKKEITPNMAGSSTPKTVQKQPTVIESNSDIAFFEGQITPLEPQKPVLEQQKQNNQGKSPVISKEKNSRDQSIHLANDLAAGLQVADKKKHIKYGTRTYKKVQTAIGSLRQGSSTTIAQAARMSGLEQSVLAQVAKWGQDRPGTFESDDQISLVQSE